MRRPIIAIAGARQAGSSAPRRVARAPRRRPGRRSRARRGSRRPRGARGRRCRARGRARRRAARRGLGLVRMRVAPRPLRGARGSRRGRRRARAPRSGGRVQPSCDGAAGEAAAVVVVGREQQRAAVALGEVAGREQVEHLVGQVEQPQEVRDRDARAADAAADVLARETELLDEQRRRRAPPRPG